MPTIATMFNWLYFNISFEDSLGHCFLVFCSFFSSNISDLSALIVPKADPPVTRQKLLLA